MNIDKTLNNPNGENYHNVQNSVFRMKRQSSLYKTDSDVWWKLFL